MTVREALCPTTEFRRARDTLVNLSRNGAVQVGDFRLPVMERFNWALDWFDKISTPDAVALWVCGNTEDTRVTFRDLSRRSNQVANWLASLGVGRGDRVFLLLGNSIPLYEIILACMKLGAVVIPGFLSLSRAELSRRIHLGGIKFLLHSNPELVAATELPMAVGAYSIVSAPEGSPYIKETSAFPDVYVPARHTHSSEPMFGYFTSGTTSDPKLVIHSHSSYPIGHLSSMYWNGVRPGDKHFNVSAPGWAKHTWSSFFVPWNAEATVVALEQASLSTDTLLDIMRRRLVTSFCAPPSTWRTLVRGGLGERPSALREITTAGEALDFTLVEAIYRSWGLWLRDGYGQTETTAQIGHPPGTIPKPGTLGKPLPGYEIVLIDPQTGKCGDEGEISIPLDTEPVGLMLGYESGQGGGLNGPEGYFYRTGDLAYRDPEGYIVLQGRIDDLFKCRDHRVSPFELEKILLQHPNVAEAVIVPFSDQTVGTVPKAFVRLAPETPATSSIARDLFAYLEARISPDFRIHRIQFIDAIPKTQSGKTLRRALREPETGRVTDEPKPGEFLWQSDALQTPSTDKVVCHA